MKIINANFGTQSFLLSKLFRLIAYAFSICCFGFYVYTSFYKLYFNPEIIKSTREVNPKNFPLPAITICPHIFARDNLSNYARTRYNFFNKKKLNMSEEECYALTANLNWCKAEYLIIPQNYCKQYKYDDIDVIQTIRETAFKFFNMTTRFDVVTNMGVCYSSNLLNPLMIYNDEVHNDIKMTNKAREQNLTETEPFWSPERGFDDSKNTTLLKGAIPGQKKRFNLPLFSKDDENFCVRKKFKVYIHKPNEIAIYYHPRNFIDLEESVGFTVTVKSYRTDPALRNFPVDFRKCYFEGERKLQFFKTYSKILCEWECITNTTLEKCGCVRYSMPRNQTTKVCNATQMLDCVTKVSKKICDCYSPCNDVEYHYTTERFAFDTDAISHKNVNFSTFAGVEVKINVLQETVEEVENLLAYKITNFISDFGGFLGLFLGCSLLSILENFHLIFARICSKIIQSKGTAPKESSQRNDVDTFVTKNDLRQFKIEQDEQRRKFLRKFDKIDETCMRHKNALEEVLKKLDMLTKKIDASKNKSSDEELINETFLRINEHN